MRIAPLTPSALPDARALLTAALPHDQVGVVAEEKLFGDNGARRGQVSGAWQGAELVGLVATAGRWIKLLCVAKEARGHGVGRALFGEARAQAGGQRLRVGDHPGNYLSPGLDERYQDGRAFFRRCGLVELGQVENIRAPLDGNPLVTEARAAAATAAAAAQGYEVRRATVEDRALLDWVAGAFAAVWANEVAHALAGPRGAVHVALHKNSPVAFAAADGNNQGLGWFGPAGTDPEHRGKRLGEALLLRCLIDVRGLPEGGVIAWIGPKEFYRKSCGAVEDRRFVQLADPEVS